MSSSSVFHDEVAHAAGLHHDASKMGCWKRFRLVGTRAAKSLVSTAADVGGDWLFWYRAARDEQVSENIQPYVLDVLFYFAVWSSVLGVLLVYSLWRAHSACRHQTDKAYEAATRRQQLRRQKRRRSSGSSASRRSLMKRSSSSSFTDSVRDLYENFFVPKVMPKWDGCVKWLLGMEVLLEDVPQFVLSGMVIVAREGGIDDVPNYVVFNLTTSGFNLLLNVFDMLELEDLSFLVNEDRNTDVKKSLSIQDVTESGSIHHRHAEMAC